MSDDKVYKDGDIVWVKLGNSWWPGEVIGDEQRLPEEVQQLKKRPYCVVKFFQEDAYEYLKTAKHIYPFQCQKKNEFIKKGLALYNAKNAFMEKFPDDVKYAENLTRPTTTLTTKILNDRPGGLVKEMWSQGLSRRSTDYYENNQVAVGGSDSSGNQTHSTPRRDSVTTILNITPNRTPQNSETQTPNSASATSERTLSTSSSTASIVTPNVAASNRYRCNLCEFTTMRQNVLIMHRKSHSSSGSGSRPSMPLGTSKETGSPSVGSGTDKAGTPNSAKHQQHRHQNEEKAKPPSDVVQKGHEPTTLTKRNRRKGTTASTSPSPRNSSSTLKRTLRTLRAAAASIESNTVDVTETTASKEARPVTPTPVGTDDDVAVTKTGTESPTDSKNSEQIRQRLLADWSDEEKEESHPNEGPMTSRKGKSSSNLQVPTKSANTTVSVKRRSPTIVPMKTLEGAGQTLVVAPATQSKQEITTQRSTQQRIRNIPKKDRLRDFGSSITTVEEQPKNDEPIKESTTTINPTDQKSVEKSATENEIVEEVEPSVSCPPKAQNITLSCFDFQEEEEEHENDVLKSIANYKKKYFSPDKDKSGQSSTTTTTPNSDPNQSNKKVNTVEQRDKELSAEIDSLLEQTTLKEDIGGFQQASVKGLPIKERGKRIFKSRNRAPMEDEDIQSAAEAFSKPVEVPESSIGTGVEEGKQETPSRSPVTPVERKTRGSSKRVRGKAISKERKGTSSPVNGNTEKSKESVVLESSGGEKVHVSQRSKQKGFDNRIMRQPIDEDETSIPLIRHSPVEIYSCDSSLDNGTHVVLRSRRSKTRTPNSLTGVREETLNGGNGGGGGGSRASSRSRNAVPLTPTDETSSLGVSDAGAEFGSPASSLDEERLLTPVKDGEVDIQNPNEFKPIKDGDTPAGSGERISEEDDEEIESPPHEALSGSEMNDENELKGRGSKRLKSPKKKLNTKDQEQREVVGRRRKRGETKSPSANDLPKRLTRGALHHQDQEVVKESMAGEDPKDESEVQDIVDSEAKTRESRTTPARGSSRHDVVESDVESPKEDGNAKESALETQSSFGEKEIAAGRLVTPTDSKKIGQRKIKGRRSKTPAAEPEIEKTETPVGTDLVEDSSKNEGLPKEEAEEDVPVAPEEGNEDHRDKDQFQVNESESSKAPVSEESSKVVEEETNRTLTPPRKRPSTSSEKPVSPQSPVKKLARVDVPQSPVKKDPQASSLETKSGDLPHGLATEPPHIPEEILQSTESPKNQDKKTPQVDSPQNQSMKLTRWDSPEKRVPSTVSEKKSEVSLSPGKKSNRWDSSYSSNKKSFSSELVKKISRWDSPIQTEKVKKFEEPGTGSKTIPQPEKDGINKSTMESKKPRPNSPKSPPAKSPSEMKSITTAVDGNGIGMVPLSSPVSAIQPPPSQISSSFSPLTPSPTIEKVRINVDVENPLSTQIANILAASGNSIQSQQHLQIPNRNRSPKLNASSPLKRKHSLEEASAVGAITSADGDAVVAHVQSLCPQVKITRKERIIIPAGEMESHTPQPSRKIQTSSLNPERHFDISQMPIVISNEQIPTPKETNLWQTDLLQPPASDNQGTLQLQNRIGHDRLNLTSRSSLSPSLQKSPAASTGGRKQAGNIVALPSSITVKQHQHKFAEALSLADSVLSSNTKTTKRRSSQTAATSTANVHSNRRLNSAPALDVRSTPPSKVPKVTTTATSVAEHVKSSPTKGMGQVDNGSVPKMWSQPNRQEQKQPKRLDTPSSEASIESLSEGVKATSSSSSPTKATTIEDNQNDTDVEQLNSTAKITAVPIQEIPGYAETFLLCMVVDNMYKPINNIPHYLNTDLNQLVPVPPEAYEGMLPELAVDQPPANVNEATTEPPTLGKTLQQAIAQKTRQQLLGSHETNMSVLSSEDTGSDDGGFKLVLQPGESPLADATVVVDPDIAVESSADNAIVLNLENQQIILDAATFEQLLANPDANTQLVTDDGTEFVLTRELLAALKAQHDGQNVELLAIPSEQQLQEQLIVPGEAGSSSSGDLLSVALANSEFYGNDVLQIETTTLGAGGGAAGLQLLASDGSIVFQAPPLPQAHLTPPITAHTSETNAVLNQTPIMSTLEKPSTAVMSGKVGGVESPTTSSVVSAVQCDMAGMRPNLDDSLAVIGVSTQSSTVPTSLELPITITNPAIAPKVTMAQSGHGADIVQFQPHRSVATVASTAVAAGTHIYEDPIEGIN